MSEQGQNPIQFQPDANQSQPSPYQAYQPQQGQFGQQAGTAPAMQAQQWQYSQQTGQPPMQGSAPYAQPDGTGPDLKPKKKLNVLALIALIVGILAIPASITVFGGIILGVAALVLALLSRKPKLRGMGIAGLACGGLGIVLSMVVIAVAIAYLNTEIGEYTYNRVMENFVDSLGLGAPIADEAPGTVIAEDEVCKITIKRLEFDEDGNLNVYFDATNRVVKEIDITTKTGEAWLLNNEKVECICYSWVDPDQTKTDCFTIPKDYLPSDDIKSYKSLRGTLIVSLNTGFDMEYEVRL